MKNKLKQKMTEAKEIYHNIFYILKLLSSYKRRYIYIIFLLSTLSTIIPFVSLMVSQTMLNSIQLNIGGLKFLTYFLFAYVGIQLSSFIIQLTNSYYMLKYQEYLRYELNIYFDNLCSNLTLEDFENDKIYDMIQRAESQIGIRPLQVFQNILKLYTGMIGIFSSLLILANWHLWIVIIFLMLPIVSFRYFMRVSKLEYNSMYKRAKIQRQSWYLAHLLSKDYYIKEVRTLGITNYIISLKKSIQKRIYDENVMLAKKKIGFRCFYQILSQVFSLMVIGLAFYETTVKKIYLGNLTTYINTTTKVDGYVNSLAESFFAICQDSLFCKNIIDLVEYSNERNLKNNEEGKKEITEINSIEIRNLSYKYPNRNEYALKNINLTVNKKGIFAIVGENGSGKSTLIKIISGLYTGYEGEILVNGINLKDINLSSYKKILSVTFQDFNKYEFPVKENIKLGDIFKDENLDRIDFASQMTGADRFISSLPNKYSQQVGTWFEKGVQLSGGQWQKIALSRCVYREAGLYIFDEPTSSLDPTSEHYLINNLSEFLKNKMGIIITHRVKNAEKANYIYVFKNGHIVEQGTFVDLFKLNGEYSRLYHMQTSSKMDNTM